MIDLKLKIGLFRERDRKRKKEIVHDQKKELLMIIAIHFFSSTYKLAKMVVYEFKLLREKSLAIYFGDSQLRRNRIVNFIISKIHVDKR